MSYQLTDYTKKKATEIGVQVMPSKNPKKKIDVYKDNLLIASIGDPKYLDYPSYIKEKGQVYADKRRELYHKRHTKDTLKELLSRYLLW
jgi:hypothetical protein